MQDFTTDSGGEFQFRPGFFIEPGNNAAASIGAHTMPDTATAVMPSFAATPSPGIVPNDPENMGTTMAIGKEDDGMAAPHMRGVSDPIGADGTGDARMQASSRARPLHLRDHHTGCLSGRSRAPLSRGRALRRSVRVGWGTVL